MTGEIDVSNDSSSDCVRLEVKPVSYAVITGHPLQVKTGDDVHLSGFYSVGAESYQWSSGNGLLTDASAMETLWTAPSTKGSYEITLTINGDETDSINVEVYDELPIAIATTDKTLVYLDDLDSSAVLTSSSITTNNSAVDSIEWQIIDQPAVGSATLSNTSSPVSHFNATVVGDYTIQLTASKDSVSDYSELDIQVRERGVPVADAGSDIVTFRNQSARLDGSGSHDLDGLPIMYTWSSDGGKLAQATQAQVDFVSDTVGMFIATVTVNNGSHSATDDTTITVRNRLPLASDDFHNPLLGDVAAGYLHAFDSDGDPAFFKIVVASFNQAASFFSSFSGFKATSPMGFQSRVLPDQRSGVLDLANS